MQNWAGWAAFTGDSKVCRVDRDRNEVPVCTP